MRASDDRHRPCRGFVPVALAFCALLATLDARAGCTVETLELPITMVGSRATAILGINGTQVPMTVDSGAAFSMLTDAAAAQLKLTTKATDLRVQGISGRVDVRVARVDAVQLFKGDIKKVEFIVGGNDPGAGTMGLIGRNILSVADTEYDLAHGVIRFVFPGDDCKKANMAYWAGSSAVTEVDLARDYHGKLPAIQTDIKLNGKTLTAMFDSGATTLVTASAARRAGLEDSDRKAAGYVYGAGRGTSQAWTASFDRFEIGNEAISNNRLRVADFNIDDVDMLLGIDFFLSHRIYVSKQQSKIYLTYNGGKVFALDKAGVASAGADAPGGDAPGTSADEYARRGAASAARQDFASALADLDRACELEPTSAAFAAQRGRIQLAMRHPAKAMDDFDRALASDPNQVDARIARVALRIEAKDRDGAKADLDVLDGVVAPQAQMRLAMSRLNLTLARPAQALVELNDWIASHPNELDAQGAFSARCRARLMLGVDLDKALDDCDEAVDREPKNAIFLEDRGWVHLRLGKDKKAVADFDRSVESQPRRAGALFGRGLSKTKLGDTVAGEADLAAARTIAPDIEGRLTRTGLIDASVTPH